MSSTKAKKRPDRQTWDRLEARITPSQKALFRRAASLEGRTLTDFVISCVSETARRIVQEHEVLLLSEKDRSIFVEALLTPPRPNDALMRATRRYAKEIGGMD